MLNAGGELAWGICGVDGSIPIKSFAFQAQHLEPVVAGPQQEFVAAGFSANHRSRGLQLAGLAANVTSILSPAMRGDDAQ